MSSGVHESDLSAETLNVHRALASMQEELEAVDWYNQRADATQDSGLEDLLIHNRNEEIEHASMLLEYLRRNIPAFDEQLRTYLFTSAPVTEVEESGSADAESGGENADSQAGGLGIGNLS